MTGEELEKIDSKELKERIKDINIFARVVPDQKLKIVEALKQNGEVVAMTGDGVNDGPALKAAHIGVAMGDRGTDVARESADLILLNDDFTSIVKAVKLGRRIYDNLQKAVSYIFSVHIPIAGVALFPTLLGLPTVLFPVHIAFLELIIDPACSTVFESEEPEGEIMKRRPRGIGEPLFGKSQVFISLLHGGVLLVSVMAVFILAIKTGRSESVARTMAFITLILSNLVLILANLSKESSLQKFRIHRNKALYLISSLAVVVLVLIMKVPFLTDLFHFSVIKPWDLGIVLCMTVFCYVWLEFFKIFRIGGLQRGAN